MNNFTIRDLESLSGIKAHTIRIWEQRYSFIKPQRTDTNIRYYSNEELRTILNIALLNKYGFKISVIDKMNEEEINQKLFLLTDLKAQQEKQVNDLISNMINMDVDKLEFTMDHNVRQHGIEQTIHQLIFPFLERIGILWQTNHINPGQEHLVTSLIRQKLIVGINNVSTGNQSDKTVLLFLPEGEHHELGLLYMYYLLKSKGVRVLYLGANVPAKDVAYVAGIKRPDFLYTHITCLPGNFKLEKYLNLLHGKIAQIPIIISGSPAQIHQKQVTRGIEFKKTLADVLETLTDS